MCVAPNWCNSRTAQLVNSRPSGELKDPEELDWRLDNSEECGSGREKSETNPSNHPLLFHRQEDQQN